MNAIELDTLSVTYATARGRLTAVAGVDFGAPSGATSAIIGESGSGKSTIARAIVGLVPIASGSVHVYGRAISDRSPAAQKWLRSQVQLIFQDPYASLNPRMDVRTTLHESASLASASGNVSEPKIVDLLEQVGLGAQHLEVFPHQLSGGQRQRLAIARALARNPRVLILDEVTSALDVSVQAAILNLLRGLQRKLGLTYILITHDLAVARYMATSVSVMYLGRVVEAGASADILVRPRHPYTRSLLDAVPRLNPWAAGARLRPTGEVPDPLRPPVGCRFHTRCPIGPRVTTDRTVCTQKDPGLVEIVSGWRCACHFPLTVSAPAEAPKAQAGARAIALSPIQSKRGNGGVS